MAKDLIDIHAEAIKCFDSIQYAIRDERLQCLQDRRFYSIAGAQWEGSLGEQFANKPKFEVNKCHLAVMRIINEYRNNRITVDFISKDGSEYDKLADTCDGLYRADEQDSVADEAYDNAFEEAVAGGFGAWRLRTEYENEEDEDDDKQRIKIEPIFDADSSVFFDLDAKRQDKSDAKKCFVITSMTHDAYMEQYEDDPATWEKDITSVEFDWCTPDIVYLAEYYCVENTKETVYTYKSANDEEERYTDEDFEADPDLLNFLTSTGFKLHKQKKINRKRVRKFLMNGNRIIEDMGYIAGKNIPIVPVYGKRWFIDNVERCMGHVRLAKDAQRLKNMQLSKLGEISALSSVQKPIFTPEQMAGNASMWAEDNIKNYPYLLVNPITDSMGNQQASGAIGYTQSPEIPPAMAALLQITETDISDLLGNQQVGEQMVSNISGKAVELVQNKIDMQSYIYMSNFAKGMRRCGEIWLGMAKDVYYEPKRKMKAITKDGEVNQVELAMPMANEDGEVEYENDLKEAQFDVISSVGPSSSSKRSATVRALTGLMQIATDPETLQVLGGMAMMNMEGEGIDDVRAFFRNKLVRMGAVKPTEKEIAKMQNEAANQVPDAQSEYLKSAAQEAEAKAAGARANTILTIAKAEETKAKTAEIMASMSNAEQDQMLKLLDAIDKSGIDVRQLREDMASGQPKLAE